ncbi:MAG TPA: DUF2147 domain-containing protein [Pseudolabrys sp.]|nr:DUF2147 domain-containing protein [Pseudolabrys sp.]
MRSWLYRLAVVLALAPSGNLSAQPADPTGEWLVADRIARIRIANCGGSLWGVVSWEAQPGVDEKNPDPDLRSRPTLGMPVLLDMTQSKSNQWEGKIYNAKDGHTYSARIMLSNPRTLRVEGCFLGFLCGGENWTRVESNTVGRSATGSRNADPVGDVCSKVSGLAGSSHERRLK